MWITLAITSFVSIVSYVSHYYIITVQYSFVSADSWIFAKSIGTAPILLAGCVYSIVIIYITYENPFRILFSYSLSETLRRMEKNRCLLLHSVALVVLFEFCFQ